MNVNSKNFPLISIISDSNNIQARNSITETNRNLLFMSRTPSFDSQNSCESKKNRPVTARSLPTKVETNFLPPKVNVINVSSKNLEKTLTSSNIDLRETSSFSSPGFNIPSFESSPSRTKTNLDQFIDYSISPFTTRYELIGDNKFKSKSANNLQNELLVTRLEHVKLKEEPVLVPLKTNFVRITDNLYIGNINSIKNERKMCKLKLEYLIDMTNMRPDDLNRKTLGKLPCTCKNQHSRLYLTIEITDTSFKCLFNAFGEVNKFIQKARKSPDDKRVLIFGKETYSPQVLTAVTQYLMVEYEMNMNTALESITQKNFDYYKSNLEKSYLNYLKEFEMYLKHMSISLYGNLGYFEPKNEKGKNYLLQKDYGYLELEKSEELEENEVEIAYNPGLNKQQKKDKNYKSLSKSETKLKVAWM